MSALKKYYDSIKPKLPTIRPHVLMEMTWSAATKASTEENFNSTQRLKAKIAALAIRLDAYLNDIDNNDRGNRIVKAMRRLSAI